MQKISLNFSIVIILAAMVLFQMFGTAYACPLHNPDGTLRKLKVLHLTFHKGCVKEFEGVASDLSLDLETWFIPDLPPKFFDGATSGNALYNIGHERAERIWETHKDYFQKFDAILTSDTAPLSRIFLQNGFSKPLIIWICNRFDYSDEASLDCDFPDAEYYQLFSRSLQMPNVTVAAYTAFEHYYAHSKGIDTGHLLITPCSSQLIPQWNGNYKSSIPDYIVKENTFFLPPYHNEKFYMDLSKHCSEMEIPNYCGRYNGAWDLQDFKGIIHLPYSWSNLAFFENTALGIPYFIPTRSFFRKLAQSGNFFHPNLHNLIEQDLFDLSEWYCPEHQEIITYFDSWDDLRYKIETADFLNLREKIRNFSQSHRKNMLSKWRSIFDGIERELKGQGKKT